MISVKTWNGPALVPRSVLIIAATSSRRREHAPRILAAELVGREIGRLLAEQGDLDRRDQAGKGGLRVAAELDSAEYLSAGQRGLEAVLDCAAQPLQHQQQHAVD